jgi:hypothetical protein
MEALRNGPRSPCVDQSAADVEAYYRNVQPGDRAAVRHTQDGILRYDILSIREVNPRIGRIYLSLGAFFMKSGKKYSAPTGQTQLVVPTESVLAWAEAHPDGASGYATFKADEYPFA